MTPTEFINESRALLGPNGEHWTKGDYADGEGNRCRVGALYAVPVRNPDVRQAAYRALHRAARALSIQPCTVESFNDHPATTWEDIVLLDKHAIAILEELA